MQDTPATIALTAGEQRQKERMRQRVTDSPIDFQEGDKVIAEEQVCSVARIAYADEDSLSVWPDDAPAWRKQWGPLCYRKSEITRVPAVAA